MTRRECVWPSRRRPGARWTPTPRFRLRRLRPPPSSTRCPRETANGSQPASPDDTQPLPVLVFEADDPSAASHTAPPSGGVRARLARFANQRSSSNPVLEPLIKTVRSTHPKADLRVVERAYDTAERFHEGQKRRSGDPYITHPLAVATILAELGMTPPTLCAALLHDTVEDTPYTLNQLRQDFGDEVAHLVDGVTKLDKVKYGAAAAGRDGRKMVVAMALTSASSSSSSSTALQHADAEVRFGDQRRAHRAGDVGDLRAARPPPRHEHAEAGARGPRVRRALPKMYDEIVRLVAERRRARDEYLAQVIEQVDGDLRTAKIKASVKGRPKHYYSIYQKMIVRGRDFTDIYDLVGIRILVESVRDCYAVLGTIHARWNPVPGRFKDFIAMPKFNMYQSLHTTVIGPGGKPVELQIRTTAMHNRAEYGIAAHWKYKEDPSKTGPRPVPTAPDSSGNDMAWLRQLLDWQKETEDPGEFLESLRFDLNTTEVFVFTPKGDVISLPSGSTPVDFAYAVHTEVGHRCIGARVNGRLVPLESHLDNGDLVEIFTSKAPGAAPSRDWLTFVQSARARNKIRAWFSKERREEAIEKGKDAIARLMRKQNLPLQRLLGGDSLMGLAQEMRYADISALYAAVGEGHVSAQNIVARLVQSLGGEDGATEEIAEATTPTRNRKRIRTTVDPGVVVKGASDVWVKLAKCCTPVPGDSIVGFVTRGSGVSVHRSDCSNVGSLSAEVDRMVEVEWSPSASSVFLVAIQVEALDRSRLLSDVTRVLSDQHVNILSASVTTTRDRIALSRFTFEMGDPKHLGHVLRAVRGVEGVFDAYRITSGNTN